MGDGCQQRLQTIRELKEKKMENEPENAPLMAAAKRCVCKGDGTEENAIEQLKGKFRAVIADRNKAMQLMHSYSDVCKWREVKVGTDSIWQPAPENEDLSAWTDVTKN